MTEVYVTGTGMTPVGEHWALSLRQLGVMGVRAAMADHVERAGAAPEIEALFVGNAVGEIISSQAHLAALIADYAGGRGVEAFTLKASDASGGAAVRQAFMAIKSGMYKCVMALGVEKATDWGPGARARALMTGADADYEAVAGTTPESLAALLMRRYLHETGGDAAAMFGPFAEIAHANGARNPLAMFQSPLRDYARGPMIAPPLSLFDAAPEADGAAAVILSANPGDARPAVRVAASAVGTDAVAIADRRDLLYLRAAALSAKRAYDAAGIVPGDIDVFELHDSFSVLAALSLEACGMRQPGDSGPVTRPAISTFGGLKARGHPIGATGVYQIAEVTRQLRGDAGPNQVESASLGLAQCLGGMGGTAVTHILTKSLVRD